MVPLKSHPSSGWQVILAIDAKYSMTGVNYLNKVLNDNRYGPGNRPHWALNKTRFPNLIKALNEEPDMGIRKRVSSLYQALTG